MFAYHWGSAGLVSLASVYVTRCTKQKLLVTRSFELYLFVPIHMQPQLALRGFHLHCFSVINVSAYKSSSGSGCQSRRAITSLFALSSASRPNRENLLCPLQKSMPIGSTVLASGALLAPLRAFGLMVFWILSVVAVFSKRLKLQRKQSHRQH